MTPRLVGGAVALAVYSLGFVIGARRRRRAERRYIEAVAFAPFFLSAMPGETDAELRERCRATMQVPRG